MEVINNYLPSLISVAIVIVGWRILFLNAKRITTRTETFSIIRDLTTTINTVADEGSKLWYESSDYRNDLGKINPRLSTIRGDIKYLNQYRNIKVPYTHLINIRRAITLNLERVEKGDTLENRRMAAANIHDVCQEFKHEVLTKFETRYPPSK